MNLRETLIRNRIRNWCGGVDDDCAFRVIDDSDSAPQPEGTKLVTVGAEWLRRNGIRPEVLESPEVKP